MNYNVLIEEQQPANGTLTEKDIVAITNQDELDLATAIYGEPPIGVDFNNGQVLLVDMGIQPSGGYSIELASIEEFDTYVNVNINFLQPADNCIVTLALTNPYTLSLIHI